MRKLTIQEFAGSPIVGFLDGSLKGHQEIINKIKIRQTIISHIISNGKNCLTYSSLQHGMEYYVEDGIGVIAYMSYCHPVFAPFGRKIILSDPICSPEHMKGILNRFIAQHKNVIILQCSASVGYIMETLGHEVNHFGHESELPLPFSLSGKKRAKLRQWRNKCEREGVVIEERPISECNLTEIEALSRQWLQSKGEKELTFLTRPFVAADEPDVRCFWARKDGKLVGLAIFDPIYDQNRIIGYYHNFDRITSDAPNGTSAYLILEAMKAFEADHVRKVSLGLMPLYILRPDFRQNHFTMEALKFAFRTPWLNKLYPFKGSASHKKKFAGDMKPTYFSSTRGNSLREVFIILKALRIL